MYQCFKSSYKRKSLRDEGSSNDNMVLLSVLVVNVGRHILYLSNLVVITILNPTHSSVPGSAAIKHKEVNSETALF